MRSRFLFTTALMGLLVSGWSLQAQPPEKAPKVSLGIMVEQTAPDVQHPGVVVRETNTEGPAAKAGVQAGDIIMKAGDKKIKDVEDLFNALANHKPGDKFPLQVFRAGKEKDLTVTLGKRTTAAVPPRPEGTPGVKPRAFLGVQSQPVTADLKNRLGLATDKGALITEVVADTPAAKAGLKTDDVITAVNGKTVNDPAQLSQAIRHAGVGKDVTLKVMRGQETKELKATLDEAPSDVTVLPGTGAQGFPGIGRLPFGSPEDHSRIEKLEHQVQDLQKRIRELEQKQNRSGDK